MVSDPYVAQSKPASSQLGSSSTVPTRDPDMIERARAEQRLWSIDTGHDLMITEPDAVTAALIEIADR